VPKKAKPLHQPDDFGLDIMSGDDDLFRWFLLTFLLAKPIQSSAAVRTWKLFLAHNKDIPWAIIDMSDYELVALLHDGGYTRYQHVMTKALKTAMRQLTSQYEGSLQLMIDLSQDEDELSQRLQKIYGVGPKTAEIFMRETSEFFARRVE